MQNNVVVSLANMAVKQQDDTMRLRCDAIIKSLITSHDILDQLLGSEDPDDFVPVSESVGTVNALEQQIYVINSLAQKLVPRLLYLKEKV